MCGGKSFPCSAATTLIGQIPAAFAAEVTAELAERSGAPTPQWAAHLADRVGNLCAQVTQYHWYEACGWGEHKH